MRRLFLLAVPAVLVLALAACGGSSGSGNTLKITLGVNGGLMVPYEVTIAPGGAVKSVGHPPATPVALSSADDERLSGMVRDEIGKLKTSMSCPQTLPDVASRFITALGKTVSVRGSCEPGFEKLWNALTNALKLNQ